MSRSNWILGFGLVVMFVVLVGLGLLSMLFGGYGGRGPGMMGRGGMRGGWCPWCGGTGLFGGGLLGGTFGLLFTESALSPEIASKVVRQATRGRPEGAADQVEALTGRELDVLRLVAKGMTNREVGRELEISHRTVQGHLANVYGKLGVSSRTEAVTEALKRGWIVIE